MLACDEGNIEMVDLLLQYSADPNLQQPVSNMFDFSVCRGKVEMHHGSCIVWKHYAVPWYKHTSTLLINLQIWQRFLHLRITIDTQYWKSSVVFGRETMYMTTCTCHTEG